MHSVFISQPSDQWNTCFDFMKWFTWKAHWIVNIYASLTQWGLCPQLQPIPCLVGMCISLGNLPANSLQKWTAPRLFSSWHIALCKDKLRGLFHSYINVPRKWPPFHIPLHQYGHITAPNAAKPICWQPLRIVWLSYIIWLSLRYHKLILYTV